MWTGGGGIGWVIGGHKEPTGLGFQTGKPEEWPVALLNLYHVKI